MNDLFPGQVIAPHGFATVEWDHRAIPEKVWANLTRLPNGCWVAPTGQKGSLWRELFIERIAGVIARNAWAITPTCGDVRCANPAHTCFTMKTAVGRAEVPV